MAESSPQLAIFVIHPDSPDAQNKSALHELIHAPIYQADEVVLDAEGAIQISSLCDTK